MEGMMKILKGNELVIGEKYLTYPDKYFAEFYGEEIAVFPPLKTKRKMEIHNINTEMLFTINSDFYREQIQFFKEKVWHFIEILNEHGETL
jgi:hypothetical protein